MSLGITVEILRAVSDAADVLGPLKSAAGGALHIAEAIQKFKQSKKDWNSLSERIQVYVAFIAKHILEDTVMTTEDLKKNLEALRSTLVEIEKEIEELQIQKFPKRILTFLSKNQDVIQELQQKFDKAIELFQFQSTLTSSSDIAKTLQGASTERILKELLIKFREDIVVQVNSMEAFNRLPDPAGVSWDSAHACHPDTRTEYRKEILDWIATPRTESGGAAGIFLVADAVGSGKTALAHAVCEQAHKDGYLAASFFFDRLKPEQSTPQNLFGCIIRGLSGVNTSAKVEVPDGLSALIATCQGFRLQTANAARFPPCTWPFDCLD